MLLSDEAIGKIIPGWITYPKSDEEIGYEDYVYHSGGVSPIHREIAKAQLKKLVEYIETQIGIHSRTADDGWVWLKLGKMQDTGVIRNLDWLQELKEELDET